MSALAHAFHVSGTSLTLAATSSHADAVMLVLPTPSADTTQTDELRHVDAATL